MSEDPKLHIECLYKNRHLKSRNSSSKNVLNIESEISSIQSNINFKNMITNDDSSVTLSKSHIADINSKYKNEQCLYANSKNNLRTSCGIITCSVSSCKNSKKSVENATDFRQKESLDLESISRAEENQGCKEEYHSNNTCNCLILRRTYRRKTSNDITSSLTVENNEQYQTTFASILNPLDSFEENENLAYELSSYQSTVLGFSNKAVSNYPLNTPPAYATLTPLRSLPPISTMSDKFVYQTAINECNENDGTQNMSCIEINSALESSKIDENKEYKKSLLIRSDHQLSCHQSIIGKESTAHKSLPHGVECFDFTCDVIESGFNTSPFPNASAEETDIKIQNTYKNEMEGQSRGIHKSYQSKINPHTQMESSYDACNCHEISSLFGCHNTRAEVTSNKRITTCHNRVCSDHTDIGFRKLTCKKDWPDILSDQQTRREAMFNTSNEIQQMFVEVSTEHSNIFPLKASPTFKNPIQMCSNQEEAEKGCSDIYPLHVPPLVQKDGQNIFKKSDSCKKQCEDFICTNSKPIKLSNQTKVISCHNIDEINTKDLAQCISTELKRYSIPQAIFAQRVLCRSQGTLSDLLRNPKPWSKLKSGRETFRRMLKWLERPEYQRMSSLKTCALQINDMLIEEGTSQNHDMGKLF